MSRTYKATGINLKSTPLGESDRLLTILTREFGLIRAVAPGSRKPNSKLGGRTGLFVVNELLIYQGRSLDKITQAETLESYPGLSKDLGKLTAGQYLAELVLCQALSEQPQEELFSLICEHLRRLDRLCVPTGCQSSAAVFPLLAHGIYHLLALAGIAPQVHTCSLTQRPLTPDFTDPNWRVGFSILAGGTFSLSELDRQKKEKEQLEKEKEDFDELSLRNSQFPISKLNAAELAILQQLAQPELPPQEAVFPYLPVPPLGEQSLDKVWLSIELLLRQYAQYHFGRSIRSAALMNTYTVSRQ